MKVGNISQTVWRRSVNNQLDKKDDNLVNVPSYNDTVMVVKNKSGELSIVSTGKSFGKSSRTALYATMQAVNEILLRKGRVDYIVLEFTLPIFTSESQLKSMIENVKIYAKEKGILLSGVTTEVNPAVSRFMCCATAYGVADKQVWIESSKLHKDEDIVLVGSVALEGMSRIVDEKEEELENYFNGVFLRQCKGRFKELDAQKAADVLEDKEILAVRQIGSGGIMAALWNITEESNIGFEAYLSQMTVYQETIEVLEHYNLNPYDMTSLGSFLVMAKDGKDIVRTLDEKGVKATIIGTSKEGNIKVIVTKDDKRFLDRPAPDELMRWWQEELS